MKITHALRLALLAGGTLIANTALAQTNATWLAPVSGNWNDGANWSTNPDFPNNGGTLYNATIATTGAAFNINLNTPIALQNFSLTSADATFRLLSANNFTINQALTLTASRIQGNAYSGTLRVRGASALTGVALDSLGPAFFEGGITFAGSTSDDINDTCVVHGGSGAWSGTASINLRGNSELIISSGSTFTISSNASLTWDNTGTGANVTNSGTIIKTSTGTTQIQSATFNNTGTLDIRGGTFRADTLALTSNTLSAGTWHVSSGGSIDLVTTTINTNSADVTIEGATSTFAAFSNITSNSANGKITISGGNSFATAGNFNNTGRLTISSGSTFAVPTGSTLGNYNSGTGTLTGGTFDVSGIIRFDNTGVTVLDSSITLNGVASALQDTSGTDALLNTNRITTDGKLALKGGKTFTTTGNFKVDGTNSGILDIDSASEFTVLSGFSLDNYNNGTKTLSEGDFRIAGKITFDNTGIEKLNSKLTLDGPTAQVVNPANTDALIPLNEVQNGGAFTLTNNATFTANPSNTGGFLFTVGTTGRIRIDSGSQLDIQGDLVNYSGGTFTNGDFSVEGTLRANNITSIFTISNTIALTSATSLITNFTNVDVFETVSQITPSGNFRISGGRQLTLTNPGGVQNAGTFTIGAPVPFDTARVTIAASYTQGPGSNTVVQNGGRLIVNGNYNLNGGTLNITSSQLNVNANFNQSGGTARINTGGLLIVAGAYTLSGGEVILTGGEINTGEGFTIQSGGILSGEGVINGSMVVGGTISPGTGQGFAPGDAAGRIMITGSTLIQSSSVLEMTIGAAFPAAVGGYDQIAFADGVVFENGAAGTLRLIVTQRPNPGDVYIPITFSSALGSFSAIEGLRIDDTMYFAPIFIPNGLGFIAVEIPAAGTLLPLGIIGFSLGSRCRRNQLRKASESTR